MVREGQAILREYRIDPLQGQENLTWAPNKGHTIDEARRLVDQLRAAQTEGDNRDTIVKILTKFGESASKR